MQIAGNSGKHILKQMCKAGAGREGWVECAWPRPGAGALSRKITYAMADDVSFASGIQVGTGIYDKITMAELSNVIEKIADPSKYSARQRLAGASGEIGEAACAGRRYAGALT